MDIIDVVVTLLLVDVALGLVVAVAFGDRIIDNYYHHNGRNRFPSLAATFLPPLLPSQIFQPTKSKRLEKPNKEQNDNRKALALPRSIRVAI